MSINYKPILPAGLVRSRNNETEANFGLRVKNNMSLKNGVVLEVLETSDEKNQSKLVPEYNVMVIEDGNTAIYKNIIAVDGFGGNADYMQKKYRAPKDPKKVQQSGSFKDQDGSIVLLLCLDGNAEKAVILSSISHPSKIEDDIVLSKEKGHHLEGEFNGLFWSIDKEGALRIEFKSATEVDGTPKDEEAGGTFLTIEKDGSVQINTGEDGEVIRIDKTTKDISITAGNNVSAKAETDVNIESGANTGVTVGADLAASISGSAAITIGSSLELKAESDVKVISPTIEITADTLFKVQSQQINLMGETVLVGGAGAPALVLSTQFLGTGNLGAPVISQAIGPFSSKVLIAT